MNGGWRRKLHTASFRRGTNQLRNGENTIFQHCVSMYCRLTAILFQCDIIYFHLDNIAGWQANIGHRIGMTMLTKTKFPVTKVLIHSMGRSLNITSSFSNSPLEIIKNLIVAVVERKSANNSCLSSVPISSIDGKVFCMAAIYQNSLHKILNRRN